MGLTAILREKIQVCILEKNIDAIVIISSTNIESFNANIFTKIKSKIKRIL